MVGQMNLWGLIYVFLNLCTHTCTHTPFLSSGREGKVYSFGWKKFSEPGVQRGGKSPKQILLSVSLASADAATAGARSSLVRWELMLGSACRPDSMSGACSRWEQQDMPDTNCSFSRRLSALKAVLALSSQKSETLKLEFFITSLCHL